MKNLNYYFPEMILIQLMVLLFFLRKLHKTVFYFTLVIGLFLIYYFTLQNLSLPPVKLFLGSLSIDSYSSIFKALFIIATMATIYLSQNSTEIYDEIKPQFALLSLGVLLGGMFLVSSNNFLTIYLSIEILSIFSYVLAAIKKNDVKAAEGGAKFVIYGIISSGIMLFGISQLYGLLGTTEFGRIDRIIYTLADTHQVALMGSMVLFLVGLGFKAACFPFHMWAPDVYEGAPVATNALFTFVPILAALVALTRITNLFFGSVGNLHDKWVNLLQIMAVLTMTIGNITAINQRSVKRTLAFAGIASSGVMLLAVMLVSDSGNQALLFYGISYLFSTTTAYMVINFVTEKYDNDNFERFNGLFKKYPVMAIALSLALLSMATLPPLAGFAALFTIISAVIQKQYYGIALITVLNSLIALYYYLKLIGHMIFKKPETEDTISGFNFLNQLVIAGICLPVVLLGVFWEKIVLLVESAKLLN